MCLRGEGRGSESGYRSCMASFNSARAGVFDREQRRQHYAAHLLGLNAYERHKRFMRDYSEFYGKRRGEDRPKDAVKTDHDTLRETYRFIRTEEDDSEENWEQRLAKRYYEKLFREYCVADMSRYKENKIGMRWRGEKEVVAGKGQFVCGNKQCGETENLHSYEVNFVYKEAGEEKQALVKLRVCPRCAYKLNYKKGRERKRRLKRRKGLKRKLSERDGENPNSGRDVEPASERSEEDTGGSSDHYEAVTPSADRRSRLKSSDGAENKIEDDECFTGMFL